MRNSSRVVKLLDDIAFSFSRRTVEAQAQQLALSVSNLLSLCANDSKSFDAQSIQEYTMIFARSVWKARVMSLKDIDGYIDQLYLNGFFIPSLKQYERMGMYAISSRMVYVPDTIRSTIPEWKEFRKRASDAGLLLSGCDYAPKCAAWIRELSYYFPGLFDAMDQVSFLEWLVRFAEDASDDRAPLPEYVARIAEVPHEGQYDCMKDIDAKIERLLRNFASTLKVSAEVTPTDMKGKVRRIYDRVDRYMVVHNWRMQNLISDEMSRLPRYEK